MCHIGNSSVVMKIKVNKHSHISSLSVCQYIAYPSQLMGCGISTLEILACIEKLGLKLSFSYIYGNWPQLTSQLKYGSMVSEQYKYDAKELSLLICGIFKWYMLETNNV